MGIPSRLFEFILGMVMHIVFAALHTYAIRFNALNVWDPHNRHTERQSYTQTDNHAIANVAQMHCVRQQKNAWLKNPEQYFQY